MNMAISLNLMGLATDMSPEDIAFGPAQHVLNSAMGFSSILQTSIGSEIGLSSTRPHRCRYSLHAR